MMVRLIAAAMVLLVAACSKAVPCRPTSDYGYVREAVSARPYWEGDVRYQRYVCPDGSDDWRRVLGQELIAEQR